MNDLRNSGSTSERRFHPNQIVTVSDLDVFKTELLLAIRSMLREGKASEKKWLKSYEVKNILNISTGTLQRLRSNGTIPYSKIGNITYYDAADIDQVIERKKRDITFYSKSK